jgi:hypothetical protein
MCRGRYMYTIQNNYKRLCRGRSYVYVFPSTNKHPVVLAIVMMIVYSPGSVAVALDKEISLSTAQSSVSSIDAGTTT